MPKFECQNKKCKRFNLLQVVEKSVIKFIDGEIVNSGSTCPECEKTMKALNPKGFTTNMTGSPNICKK